jgi:hypothetical protein
LEICAYSAGVCIKLLTRKKWRRSINCLSLWFDIIVSHGDIYQLTSGNYSVLSIANASEHSQIQKAQAMRLRDTEGSALRADRSHVAQT